MPINPNADFNQLTTWLNDNLMDEKSIVPHSDVIPSIPSKGIYFWFMHPDGYKTLSNFVVIEPIIPKYSKAIHGVNYDLVYLGTTGTGKKGNSNLTKRMEWHINQSHSTSSVISGALSTLRQGLGSLLADDLIIPNTESLINTFMKKYTVLFWIEYPDNKQLIDSDEDKLIKIIRPLLNLKNNPNALHVFNSTSTYKSRRNVILNSSKSRIKNNVINKKAKMKQKQEPTNAANNATSEILIVNCLTNKIAEGGNRRPTIFTAILNLYERGLRIMTARNVKNECLEIDNTVDWQGRLPAICNSMRNATECGGIIIGEDRDFNEFTIQFNGAIESLNLSNSKPSPKVPLSKGKSTAKLTTENETIELSKNFKVVMICAGSKNPGGELEYNGVPIHFCAQTNVANNDFLPDDKIPNSEITWRDFILANQNTIHFEAFNLYQRVEYRHLNHAFGNRFFILSAGWGLVRANFRLPDYDITFSNNAEPKNKRRYNLPPIFSDFNHLENTDDNEDIVYIGGKDYLPLFYALTQHLPNRKIIYYNSINQPNQHNGNYIYKRYITTVRTNWHYELANDIANGNMP